MTNPPPEPKDDLSELLKKLWLPITSFLGAVTLAYNFYQLWLGDQTTVTYFLAGAGLFVLVIALTWIIFSKQTTTRPAVWPIGTTISETNPRFSPSQRRNSGIGIGAIALLALAGIALLVQHRQAQEQYAAEQKQKLIVLIANFNEPKEKAYGLREEIVMRLTADFSNSKNIEILPVSETITLEQGSAYARQLGETHFADIVIWGSYFSTDNPNITIHIENLSPEHSLPIKQSETLKPVATLAKLKSFSFQQQAGQETSALISFLAGVIDFQSGNYESAIKRFDGVLTNLSTKPRLLDYQIEVYRYRANSNLFVNNFQHAIQDYDQVIKINSQDKTAYNNRGATYLYLGNHKRAIQDFNQAIQINSQDETAYSNRGATYLYLENPKRAIQDFNQAIKINPQYAGAYINRGGVYNNMGDYKRAIQDYDQSIQINPQFAMAYNNRGTAYSGLGDYQRAIQDYDQSIKINPQYAGAYYNRGTAYFNLKDYQRAIQDYDQAIQINPQDAGAYNNRGTAYAYLKDYQRAIQDFDQAIQINPQDAEAYYNRGFVYQQLGKIAEANADFAKYKELTGKDSP